MIKDFKISILAVILAFALSVSIWNLSKSNYRTNYLWGRINIEIEKEDQTVNEVSRKHHLNQARLIKEIVMNVGPEKALEILNSSSLPRDATSHFLAHNIGEAAYKMYGIYALAHCVDDGLNGCSHGLIIESVADLGFDGVTKLLDECKKISPFKFQMCVHGAGHAFTALNNYKIFPAMDMCDRLEDYYKGNPDVAQWCGSGLFMENTFGEHNNFTPKDHPYLSRLDLMYPCNSIDNKYKPNCYQNLPGWWNMFFLGDTIKMVKYCSNVPDLYLERCAQGVGAVVDSKFDNSVDKISEHCTLLGQPFPDYCFKQEAQSLFSVGQKEIPFMLCSKVVNKKRKSDCYREIFRSIEASLFDLEEDIGLCSATEKNWKEFCRVN